MKRTFILSLCLLAVSAIFAQRKDTVVIISKTAAAQEVAPAAASSAAINSCCDKDFNQKTYANDPADGYYFTKWQLAIKGGINHTHCEPVGETNIDISWQPAIDLVYNFNDLWALKVGYGCYAFIRSGLTGETHNIDLSARVNLTNLIAPHRSELSRRFNVYGNIGMGYAPMMAKGAVCVKDADPNTNYWGHYGVGVASLEFEARFNKVVGLFVDGEYRAYVTSASQKLVQPTPYINVFAANVGLRFHF